MSNENKVITESIIRRRKSSNNLIDYLYDRSVSCSATDSTGFAMKLFDTAKDFYKKNLSAHYGCVNAIEFSADGNFLFSGGDDRRILMWNTNDAMMYYTGKSGEQTAPNVMKCSHYSNIFCLAVDDENKRVLSGSNDDQVIVHDYALGSPIDVFSHDSPIFSLSLHPRNGNIFASAADNGRIAIYDIRESNTDLLCLAKLKTPFHGVMFNPWEPSFIATANSKVGIHIWDLRKPREILLKCSDEPSMAVRWSRNGRMLLALRNILPVVLYDFSDCTRKIEFDSETYFNACTMKSCCFAGANDEYILSGSDDFNLYMWKVPDPWPEDDWIGSEHLILSGHRSIVNQVRFTMSKHLIATSGVEKIIKIWSPFRLPYSEGDRDKASGKRHRVLCSSRTCTRSPGSLSHDYSQESVDEDARMIHFFDSLLQNELDYGPESFCPASSIIGEPKRKKETRLYEKLIKKKIKYLSEILIEKSKDGTSHCSIAESGCGVRGIDSQIEFSSAEEIGSSATVIETESSIYGSRMVSSETVPEIDLLRDSATASSTSFDEPFRNSVSSDSDFSISPKSEIISKSVKSKLIGEKLKKHMSKTVEERIPETSDSESDQRQLSVNFLKRKRPSVAKCYRNHAKNTKKPEENESSDSSDSDFWRNGVNDEAEMLNKNVKYQCFDSVKKNR